MLCMLARAVHVAARSPTRRRLLMVQEGEERVGRPLLERALAIQEAALGPDHPDAAAIRDVLFGEE